MIPSFREIVMGCAAALLAVAIGCDAAEPEPEPELDLRDGQTAQFKTANTDHSFSWKGCEPPWGDDPYAQEQPTEQWIADVGARMQPDLPAHALGAWLGSEGGRACEEGCASLELAWTGEAQPEKPSSNLREVRAIGRCPDKAIAYAIDVEVSTAFLCTCQ